MAIVFTEEVSGNALLKAYNNNVIRFEGVVPDKVAVKAQITGLGFDLILYPSPAGSFYFNFLEYASAAVNTKNFKDGIAYVLDPGDVATMHYNVNEGFFRKGDIDIRVMYDDASDETSTINLSFLASVTQLQTYKKDFIDGAAQMFSVLAPADNRNAAIYLKMWKGYPFELTAYQRDIAPVEVHNETTGNGFTIEPTSELTSLVLSDGLNTFDDLGLEPGYNRFGFTVLGADLEGKLFIDYEDTPECGIYVKFLNRFGRWTHWLFSKNYFETRTSKYMGEIENNYANIENTQSPTLQIGKISDSTMKVAAKRVAPEFCILLDDIFDSPKIMMFNGVPGEVNEYTSWFETRLKTSSYQIHAPNQRTKNYYLEFDNPLRNTITL